MSLNQTGVQVPECIICQDIFYQPVTLPCGHSYCRPCIKESLINKPLCPVCRNPMIGNPDNLSINFTLQNIIEHHHSELYQQKVNSIKKKVNLGQQQNSGLNNVNLEGNNQQKQEQKLENILLLQEFKMKYLFPCTTVDVNLKYIHQLQQLLVQCSDKRVIILFAKNDEQVAAYCQIIQIYNPDQINNQKSPSSIKCQVKVLSKASILDVKEVKINYSEATNLQQDQAQSLEQQNQNNQTNNQNESTQSGTHQNQRIFEDGYTFKVANAKVIEDQTIPQDQQVGLEEHAEFVIQIINEIVQNNGGLNMTTYQLQAFLQQQNFLPFLQHGYIDSVSKINEFCWIICEIFNFNISEKQRLWDAESIIERLALIKQFIKKFEKIYNITSVFSIEAPGHSEHLTWIIFGIIALVVIAKLSKEYFGIQFINHI
ncbi:ATP-dependent protease LA (LON) domain protein (macronuclear) [Tetrahymena thermophila SB210]|uniref:ATP-dependent protease LA (LON) domain protein n=1 Tax=Tetrahymena thermophila (strain SB210) TaxID=312017 RepID=Q24I84_TETTS|nr:ATP-dependent protease LA (LON) domain protein [Tetrahymena thermophila SB210]EAS07513.2 ATP-dependent protease LA (LON) domain protein [Tetrahymena thermophila SB210]|eukprot:XP_001027755.2 ATP-dependent protease LA (LON) domain protein [Tetrahymena thermophila SB210]